jgi:hypothetical protein
MTDFPAPTPQLKVIKAALDGYLTRDISNAEPYISKDFKFRTFPKDPDHPDDAKEEHIKKYGPVFAAFTDAKVSVQCRGIAFEHGLIHTIPSSRPTKWSKHQEKLSFTCVLPMQPSCFLELIVTQATAEFTTIEGTTIDYDSLVVISFVEEDGRLKVLELKDFCDPHKRSVLHSTAAKAIGGLVV